MQTTGFYLDAFGDQPKGADQQAFANNLQLASAVFFFLASLANLFLLGRGRFMVHFSAGSLFAATVVSTSILYEYRIDYKFVASLLLGGAGLLIVLAQDAVRSIRLNLALKTDDLLRIQRPRGGPPRVRHLRDMPAELVHLGIHWSVDDSFDIQYPYVRRDCHWDLVNTLYRRFPYVVIAGKGLTGKSRTAFEAVAAARPSAQLIVPRGKDQLKKLIDQKLIRRGSILWLDDLDTNKFLDELDVKDLEKLRRSGVTVVGTTTSEYSALPITLRSALERACKVSIEPFLSVDEISRAENIATEGNLRVADAANNKEIGFAASLVGIDEVMKRYTEACEIGNQEVGRAIVRAAVDCRRAGYSEPVSEEVLRDLYTKYLALPTQERFEDGINWASSFIRHSTVPLLRRGSGGCLCQSYLLDHPLFTDEPVPGPIWDKVIQIENNSKRLRKIGWSAWKEHVYSKARVAFAKSAESGDGVSMYNLGALYELELIETSGETTNICVAFSWYMKASRSEARDLPATYVLYRMYIDTDRLQEANELLRSGGLLSWRNRIVNLGALFLGSFASKRMRYLAISGAKTLTQGRWVAGISGGGYVALPIDLVPDPVPVVGYADDVAIAPSISFIVLALWLRRWLIKVAPQKMLEEAYRDSMDDHIDVLSFRSPVRRTPGRVVRQFVRRRLMWR